MIYEWSVFNRVSQCQEAEGTAPTLESAKQLADECCKRDFGTRRISATIIGPGEAIYTKHPLYGWTQ